MTTHPATDGGSLEARLEALAKILEGAAADVHRVVADIRTSDRTDGAQTEEEPDAS